MVADANGKIFIREIFMSEKLFRRIIFALLAIGLVSVIVLVCYTVYLYNNCSIISYIANGR